MYPFDGEQVFVRDCSYVAAFSDEVDDGPIERVIMDEPLVMFWMSDGTPAAMWGICPHRFYSLAKGTVVGDSIECNYHGFHFDGRNGACVKVPTQSTPPSRFRQRMRPAPNSRSMCAPAEKGGNL